MLLRTHLAAAGAFATLTAPLVALPYCAAASIIGAWLPDLDAHLLRSPAGNPFRGPFKHRAFFHSVFFLLLTTSLIYCLLRLRFSAALCFALCLFYTAGFALHVLLDALTLSPVFPLWPLRLAFHLPPHYGFRGLRTGGPADRLLGVLLALGALLLLSLRLA